MAEIMLQAWPRWQRPVDLVLPIPLHPKRVRSRGFNQAELLVKWMSRETNWQSEPNALRRIRWTHPQVGLDRAERSANVQGAFAVDSVKVINRHVLLVDDVYTTGSTLAAAAAILKAAGAASVSAYCLACATDHSDIAHI
jgi:ComF family protein